MQRDLNFFSVYKSPIDAEGGIDKVTAVGMIITGVCLLFVLGMFTFFKVCSFAANNSIASINSYLKSSTVTQAKSNLAKESSKIQALNQYAQLAGAQASAFSSIEQPDSALLGKIAKAMPADITVLSTAYKGGTFTLNCKSAAQYSAASFAHALKGAGFTSVSYASVTQASASEYDFVLTFNGTGGASK